MCILILSVLVLFAFYLWLISLTAFPLLPKIEQIIKYPLISYRVVLPFYKYKLPKHSRLLISTVRMHICQSGVRWDSPGGHSQSLLSHVDSFIVESIMNTLEWSPLPHLFLYRACFSKCLSLVGAWVGRWRYKAGKKNLVVMMQFIPLEVRT